MFRIFHAKSRNDGDESFSRRHFFSKLMVQKCVNSHIEKVSVATFWQFSGPLPQCQWQCGAPVLLDDILHEDYSLLEAGPGCLFKRTGLRWSHLPGPHLLTRCDSKCTEIIDMWSDSQPGPRLLSWQTPFCPGNIQLYLAMHSSRNGLLTLFVLVGVM